MIAAEPDYHFLIDNAPPDEVRHLLRCLPANGYETLETLRTHVADDWGRPPQKNLDLSARRLLDLGLALSGRTTENKPGYVQSPLGAAVKSLIGRDPCWYPDVMHYLHFAGYDGRPTSRKLFWSYRVCSLSLWQNRRVGSASELAAEVQSGIQREFPDAYRRRIGGNFNKGGATAWRSWIKRLEPSPIGPDGAMHPRTVHRHELTLLALHYVYRAHGCRYGHPMLLDEAVLDEVARVFFLDRECCRELLLLASRVTRAVSLSDTLAGPALTLVAPYTIESI